MAVQCGHVYHLYLPIASKDKLLVPAYINPNTYKVRFFVINSNLNAFQLNNQAILDHALQISVQNNPGFLTHDSWLLCNEVVGGHTVTEIEAISGCYRGPLDGGTIANVRNVVQVSSLLSSVEQSHILNQWP
jgi:hypothetical protein